jgi:hypothetical protein
MISVHSGLGYFSIRYGKFAAAGGICLKFVTGSFTTRARFAIDRHRIDIKLI